MFYWGAGGYKISVQSLHSYKQSVRCTFESREGVISQEKEILFTEQLEILNVHGGNPQFQTRASKRANIVAVQLIGAISK